MQGDTLLFHMETEEGGGGSRPTRRDPQHHWAGHVPSWGRRPMLQRHGVGRRDMRGAVHTCSAAYWTCVVRCGGHLKRQRVPSPGVLLAAWQLTRIFSEQISCLICRCPSMAAVQAIGLVF
jgi:hypothetical protein